MVESQPNPATLFYTHSPRTHRSAQCNDRSVAATFTRIGEWVKAGTWLRPGTHFPERMKQGRTPRSLWVHTKKERAIVVEGSSITPSSSLPHPPLGEPVLVCNCLMMARQSPSCNCLIVDTHARPLCRRKELKFPTNQRCRL